MTRKTLANFIRSCTDDVCSEDDGRVDAFFTLHDGDQDGKIQEYEFFNFYRKSCLEKEEVVR